MKRKANEIFSFVIPAALLLCATGCARDITAVCKDAVDCYDGNDNDEKSCIAEMKSERKVADIYGCKDQFDDYIGCIADNGKCDTSEASYSSSSSDDYYAGITTDDQCGTQEDTYENCMDDADAAWW